MFEDLKKKHLKIEELLRIEEHSKNLKVFTLLLEELLEALNTLINLDVRDDISQREGICKVHDGNPDDRQREKIREAP